MYMKKELIKIYVYQTKLCVKFYDIVKLGCFYIFPTLKTILLL